MFRINHVIEHDSLVSRGSCCIFDNRLAGLWVCSESRQCFFVAGGLAYVRSDAASSLLNGTD